MQEGSFKDSSNNCDGIAAEKMRRAIKEEILIKIEKRVKIRE